MRFEIVTLFPDYFSLSLKQSLIGKAWEKKLFDIAIVNLRDYATDKHHTADEPPFGGGGGMVLKLEPLDRCLKALGYHHRTGTDVESNEKDRIILTSAAGRSFDQDRAIQYSLCDRLTIICGHYLGVDERILQLYRMDEVSIGNYVLSGGEPAAAVMIDAVARLMPKVLGNFQSALDDSYMNPTVGTGTPVYTRPAEYEGLRVPEELMSGDHARVKEFRHAEAIRKCARNRPELLDLSALTENERKLLDEK